MRYHAWALKRPRQAERPYVIDLQNKLLAGLKPRLVAPLQRMGSVGPRELIEGLMPLLRIGDAEFVVFVQEAAAVPLAELGDAVCACSPERTAILNALDRLPG